jgi:hypothetical protein
LVWENSVLWGRSGKGQSATLLGGHISLVPWLCEQDGTIAWIRWSVVVAGTKGPKENKKVRNLVRKRYL